MKKLKYTIIYDKIIANKLNGDNMKIQNIFKHTFLIIRHKNKVLTHCARCGILWRGIVHDLSKFSYEEFSESVKYFTGKRSPIGVCREKTGMSYAWLHHKGRNKHHIEYWSDPDCKEHPLMPYKYAVECVCDKIAATKVYSGKDYNDSMPLQHWERYGKKVAANTKTLAFFERVFSDLSEKGEKHILNKKYMKKTYAEICGGKI